MRKSCLFLFFALSLCLLIACNPDVVQETKYTVRYANTDNNCGTIAATSSGETSAGGTVVLPSATANAGYTFSGWYTASEGGTKAGDAGASYTVTVLALHSPVSEC